jgi:hypothetical protein
MGTFKAIELDASSRRRTGREHAFDCQTRQEAITALLELLDVDPTVAGVDPTRTIVQVGGSLWTIVVSQPPPQPRVGKAGASLRRGGAKHKNVR